jgi:hypothetical protein
MYRAQDLQYIVFWSIVGPFIMVLSLFLAGGLLLSLGGPNSTSWVTGLGSVLLYCSMFGAILTAHAFALFGLLGLLLLPWRPVKKKVLTLITCAAALCLSAPVLLAIYFNARLYPLVPWSAQVRPNPSFKPSPNGKPPGPGLGYAVHFPSPGPGVLPSVPA